MITMKMETAAFNKQLRAFMKKTNISTDKVIRKVALDLLSNILRPEPYGTHAVDTGRARAGWYMSAVGLGNKMDFTSRVKTTSKSGKGITLGGVEQGKREGKFTAKLGPMTLNKYVEMVNGVDYIVYLEYGWSKQSPFGMVRISMRKMRGVLPKELSKEYKKDWLAVGRGKASAIGSFKTVRENLLSEYKEFGE